MKKLILLFIFLAFSSVSINVAAHDSYSSSRWRWTIDDIFNPEETPFAIGHRGYGENLGEIENQPIENTARAVRRAYREGIKIVEVDVVLTRDNRVVALHDDYLDDFTCVNTLTYRQLKRRVKHVSSLRQILFMAHIFSYQWRIDSPGGLVIVEIKTPSPLCDPDDTGSAPLVNKVNRVINRTRMKNQVLIESFSPEIIALSAEINPYVARALTINVLQLLTEEEVEQFTGFEVTPIDKDAGFGLEWGEIDSLFRLPIYGGLDKYIQVLIDTNAHSASIDSLLLGQAEQIQPGSAAQFIEQLKLLGLNSLVYTIDTEAEWQFFSSIGIDGIYTNDIPLGLLLQEQEQPE